MPTTPIVLESKRLFRPISQECTQLTMSYRILEGHADSIGILGYSVKTGHDMSHAVTLFLTILTNRNWS